MTDAPKAARPPARGEGSSSSPHEIERAVARLNDWFAENKHRIPLCWNWWQFRRQRNIPKFRAVRTSAIQGWSVNDLNRLFRVIHQEVSVDQGEVEIPIELLVADKSVRGSYLNAQALMAAAFDVFSARHLLGKASPRLRWFWSHYPALISEMESYVNEIRLRVDAATPVPHNQRRVFEEFRVPLKNGQQTALGKSCLFALEYTEPQGAAPYWRFRIIQHETVIVGPLVLQAKPIYHGEELLAVIKTIGDTEVILSVLTAEGE